MHVNVDVEVDEDEVLHDLSTEKLERELERRKGHVCNEKELTLIFEEFVRRGDAPQILRDYLYDRLGRIL